MREADLLKLISGLRRAELRRLVEYGWVVPERRGGDYWFREIDVARVRLVGQIRRDMSVSEDNVAPVLSLVDQVYGLRNELRRLARAVEAQPEGVRKSIAERLHTER